MPGSLTSSLMSLMLSHAGRSNNEDGSEGMCLNHIKYYVRTQTLYTRVLYTFATAGPVFLLPLQKDFSQWKRKSTGKFYSCEKEVDVSRGMDSG